MSHAGYIPIGDVCVERCRPVEHTAHISHAGYIPIGDVRVESCRIVEH